MTDEERAAVRHQVQSWMNDDIQQLVRRISAKVSFMYNMLWLYLVVKFVFMILDMTGVWP